MVDVIIWMFVGWLFLVLHYAISPRSVLSNSMNSDDLARIFIASVLGPFYLLWILFEELV